MKQNLLVTIATATIAVATIGGFSYPTAAATARRTNAPRSRIIFERALPAMNGAHLTYKVVDVQYAPGDTSTPHRHGCAVVVFVIDGAMRMQVRGGVDSVYRRGETFFESPTDIHQRSGNASATEPAHFTATIVCDRDGPVSTPVPPAAEIGH
ncbi:cupin domain-containing protein [Gemmatimonas sp.]|uniref:cupin domain-containing protein n=1 Tax=Gemmatimonas sp. TaxID=1962908 RepID=UPI003982F5D9